MPHVPKYREDEFREAILAFEDAGNADYSGDAE